MGKYLALFAAGVLVLQLPAAAQKTVLPVQNNRWAIQPDGSITWVIKDRLPHTDDIEMSGEKVSLWVQYGIDSAGACNINRTVVFLHSGCCPIIPAAIFPILFPIQICRAFS